MKTRRPFNGADLIIGVDAGGTKTRALLASLSGEVLGIGQGGPANSRTGPFEPAAAAIRTAVRQALNDHDGERVRAVCIGSAGLEQPGSETEGRLLLGDAVDPDLVLFDTDAYIAWAAAHASGAGIVVIAGTGSICLGVDARGRRVRVGGWGPGFGDEGSAFAIARSGIRCALEVLDGRSDDAAFLEALRSFVAAGGPEAQDDTNDERGRYGRIAHDDVAGGTNDEARALTAWLYQRHRSASDVARFAPYVGALAAKGNPRALAILESAGRDLAGLVHAAGRQLRNSATDVMPVALGGGVLRHSERVRHALDSDLARVGGYRTVATPPPPVIGALITALQAVALGQPRLSDASSARGTFPPATERAVARLRASSRAVESTLDALVTKQVAAERNTVREPLER